MAPLDKLISVNYNSKNSKRSLTPQEAIVTLFGYGIFPKWGRMRKAYQRVIAIIFFVFVMQQGMSDIGIANYVIGVVRPFISAELLPVITFLLVVALNFSTGSAWGIPAIVSLIILLLAMYIGANPLLVMGAIISGGGC